MRYKCIIFDCDGVLVDSEATTIGVVLEMANEFLDYKMNFNEAMELFTGADLQYCFRYIEKKSDRKFPENRLDIFRKRTFDAYRKEIQPIPGIESVLKAVKVPICVASNAPVEKIELNLGLLNLDHYFHGKFYSAYDVQKWKPEPQLFLYAAKKMNMQVEDCIVIEDSLAGVQAAIAGGFDVLAYSRVDNKAPFDNLGVTTFSDMSDLIELLN